MLISTIDTDVSHVQNPSLILWGYDMTNECCIKGCDKPVAALGLCVNHWRMNRDHGSPVAPRPLSALNRGLTPEQKFWKSVEKTDGCWLWKAGVDRDGYGVLQVKIHGVSTTKAHRYSYMLHTGEVLGSRQFVMHSCDNPRCVNPDHLKAGSALENTADMITKGRQFRGDIGHKLTADQVREIMRDPRQNAAIAQDYGVHVNHVCLIKNRKVRAEVQIDASEIVRNRRGSKGEARSHNLKDQDVRDIRASTERGTDLAKRYGISKATITDIRKGRSWKHIL
jgi:hypothetical protein